MTRVDAYHVASSDGLVYRALLSGVETKLSVPYRVLIQNKSVIASSIIDVTMPASGIDPGSVGAWFGGTAGKLLVELTGSSVGHGHKALQSQRGVGLI